MTTPGNGTVRKVFVGVVITVVAGLALQGVYSASRITAVEEQIKAQNKWIEETRKELGVYRNENNAAHVRIEDEIRDQGKTAGSKLDEIVRELKK